jgi:hypothetical protein
MKFSLILFALSISMTSLAAPIKVKSDLAKNINISRIERSITVVSDNGRVNVVEVDNGGSTDFASAIHPSELLITYFKDGEMNNLTASFDLGPIYSLKKAKLSQNGMIDIEVEVMDMDLKKSTKKLTVNVKNVLIIGSMPVPNNGTPEGKDILIKTFIESSEKLGL